MNSLEMVAEFHRAFNHPINSEPQPLDTPLVELRFDMIDEESDELADAVDRADRLAIVDALQDIKYVVCGAALALGLKVDVDPLNREWFEIGADMIPEELNFLLATVSNLRDAIDRRDHAVVQEMLGDIYMAAQLLAAHYDFSDDEHFEAVHAANMRKVGGPVRADGKQLKPDGWYGPEGDHERLLAA